MKDLPHHTTTPLKQRILERTLVAVRDKKSQQRKNKVSAITSLITVTILAVVVFIQSSPPVPTTNNVSLVTPSSNHVSAPLPSNLKVSMAMDGGVRTMAITPEDLARIVFDPNVKFTAKDDSYTWKSHSVLIHMNLPTTTMAITDTRY